MKKVALLFLLILMIATASYAIYFTIQLHKITGGHKLGNLEYATVLVQDGSYYGPLYDKDLYQFEINESFHLFGKSIHIDLKKYLGRIVVISYCRVEGVVMTEQPLVYIVAVDTNINFSR